MIHAARYAKPTPHAVRYGKVGNTLPKKEQADDIQMKLSCGDDDNGDDNGDDNDGDDSDGDDGDDNGDGDDGDGDDASNTSFASGLISNRI